jgi:cytochrome oxidase assembly protein ShyY1
LRVPEPDLNRDEVQGQLASVNPAGLTELLAAQGAVITDRYGRLVAESPTYSQMPVSMPKPSLDEGNHLSYAFQWLIFGIMAFIGFGWAYRNEKRLALEATGELSPRPQKANQAWQDAQFEDENQ